MAVSGVSSSRSIYGNRNVITGLASGMDTESMIENAISAYKNKITSLTQKRTKTEWKQEAYQSIINKMSVFTDKYTSYRSSNNLMSASFFDSAVKTVAKGANADKVSASGKSVNNVQISRVKQLASAASYRLSGSFLDGQTSGMLSAPATVAGEAFDLTAEHPVSTIAGSMTLTYGGSNAETKLYINFDEDTLFEGNSVEKAKQIAEEINKQLKEQTVNIGSSSYTGDDLLKNVVRAEVDEMGNITFTDPKKNNVYISAADENVRNNLLGGVDSLSSERGEQMKFINVKGIGEDLVDDSKNLGQYLEGGSLTMTLDGVQKSVKLPGQKDILENLGLEKDSEEYKALEKKLEDGEAFTEDEKKLWNESFMKTLQENADKTFGTGKFKIENASEDGGDIKLKFSAAQGSTFSVYSDKGKALGMGESGTITSYLNTNKTLGELLGEDALKELESEAVKKPLKDKDGNVIPDEYEKDENGNFVYETDSKGNTLYSFKINDKEIGKFSKDTKLSEIMSAINGSSDSDVKVSYSRTTNEILFTAKETGENSKIEMSGLSAKLFGAPGTYDAPENATYTKGQDAIFSVSINGSELKDVQRSSNSVDFDGLTINLKGTFGYETNADGSVKYEQEKDDNGNLIFRYNNGEEDKEIYGKANKDGGYTTVGKTGNPYKFSSSKEEYQDLVGKEILMRTGDDGNPSFYVKKADGEEVRVYARLDSKKNLWFSPQKGTESSMNANVQAAMSTNAVETPGTEAVSFETSSDADKIVDAVKQMIDDYNEMATEIKNAYSTLPAQRSNGVYYEPLTDEDEEGMTESAIKNWTEKAKQGILFGDNDLRSLYQRLTSAISVTGENGAALRSAGITVNYANGLSTIDFDEDKFRAALNNDPDKVRDAFTASTESGAASNGLMQALKQPLDMYGKTSGGKGILVEKAGSPLAPTTMYTNTIQKELDRIDEQIEKWEDKMGDQIDHYTNQFSRLEQLIQQMNSQSSYFSQLMGG